MLPQFAVCHLSLQTRLEPRLYSATSAACHVNSVLEVVLHIIITVIKYFALSNIHTTGVTVVVKFFSTFFLGGLGRAEMAFTDVNT